MTEYRWEDDLLWCPSQCYCDVVSADGTPAVLYLRWRWDDPWTGEIIRGFARDNKDWAKEGEWSGNLIGDFTDEQIDEAKAALIAAWETLEQVRKSADR